MSKIRTYESNSQLSVDGEFEGTRCSWCQRYELMRAIHNWFCLCRWREIVVPDVKDTNLWEQFTTCGVGHAIYNLLFLMSKIRTYESNSQQSRYDTSSFHRCSWCQRYELMRAIHNWIWFLSCIEDVVPDVKDTNLWEQFTTKNYVEAKLEELFLMSKIRTYESNSQPECS